jgi:DNA-directed RNA polymerase III subunit RPC8
MFNLVKVEDTVKIPPSEFHLPMHDAVVAAVNCKYANKVVLEVGLCIQLYDIVSIGDAYLHPGSAAQHVTVIFRMVVFRPFVGEILVGTIRSSSSVGLFISLDFFDDIVIPPDLMNTPTLFDEAEKVWAWKFNGTDFFMDEKERIRFRVTEVIFNSSNTFVDGSAGALPPAGAAIAGCGASAPPSALGAPGGRGGGAPHGGPLGAIASTVPAMMGVGPAQSGMSGGAKLGCCQRGGPASSASAHAASAGRVVPMVVKGCTNEDGLGLTSWWDE